MFIVTDSLSEKTIQVLQRVLKEQFNDLDQHFDWKTLDGHQSLSNFLEKHPQTAIIFASNNRNLFEARMQFIRHESDVLKNLPSTFQNNIFDQQLQECYAFPLLINPVKLAYINRSEHTFGDSKIQFLTVEDMETLCNTAKSKESFPFICAGGNDEQLFALISAVAAMLGLEIVPDELASSLQENTDLRAGCPPALKAVLEKLVVWRQQGFLHPEWFRLVESDVATFMQFKSTTLVCMSFSMSRNFTGEAYEKFTTIPLPLPTLLEKKNMAADVIVYAQTAQKADDPIVNAIRDFLYLQETNVLLARQTGLAPVFSAAQTQDAEASAGRYWVAASNKAMPFFDNLVCSTSEAKAQLAMGIRHYLEVNGIGY